MAENELSDAQIKRRIAIAHELRKQGKEIEFPEDAESVEEAKIERSAFEQTVRLKAHKVLKSRGLLPQIKIVKTNLTVYYRIQLKNQAGYWSAVSDDLINAARIRNQLVTKHSKRGSQSRMIILTRLEKEMRAVNQKIRYDLKLKDGVI